MKNKNLFWGLFLIIIAICMLLDSFGYFHNIGLFKIAFTCILIAITVKGIKHISFPMMLFPIAFIGILYSNELGINSLTPWPILIITLLLSTGLSLIFKKSYYKHNYNIYEKNEKVINEQDNSNINCTVSFGSITKYINTDDFQNIDIDCSFASAKVYFDKATIIGNSANINLKVSFSGVELYIPKNWKIIKKVSITLGSIEEKNNHSNEVGPSINLCGNTNFSDIEIIYV
ncbi:MAG: hypothetical protein GX275_13665 [Clostridiales bacterium]|nr:hypothetical protein [Clostridiales bacterium]